MKIECTPYELGVLAACVAEAMGIVPVDEEPVDDESPFLCPIDGGDPLENIEKLARSLRVVGEGEPPHA